LRSVCPFNFIDLKVFLVAFAKALRNITRPAITILTLQQDVYLRQFARKVN